MTPLAAALLVVVGMLVPATPAPPQCRYGPDVTADCPAGCPDTAGTGQSAPCSGPMLDPLLPPQPPVEVEIGAGVG
mgnify:FL=1